MVTVVIMLSSRWSHTCKPCQWHLLPSKQIPWQQWDEGDWLLYVWAKYVWRCTYNYAHSRCSKLYPTQNFSYYIYSQECFCQMLKLTGFCALYTRMKMHREQELDQTQLTKSMEDYVTFPTTSPHTLTHPHMYWTNYSQGFFCQAFKIHEDFCALYTSWLTN